MATESYMRVENVVKKFGPFTALDGVDLDVTPCLLYTSDAADDP